MRGLSVSIFTLLALVAQPCSAAWDLATDWSDLANPNDVWSYRGGSNVLTTHQSSWQPGNFSAAQPAWAAAASGNNSIPAWFQSNGAVAFQPSTTTPDPTYDAPVGSVITHTVDSFNGNDANVSNVLWTSPVAGTVTISGGTWQARKSLGRSNDWALLVNGAVITGGSLTSNDAFTSGNPFDFANGSGGANVLTVPVSVGDTISFRAQRTSQPGDFVGVNLLIDIPEPATAGALMFLAGAAALRRRC